MKNIITTQPNVGDILFFDKNKKKQFILVDTFDASTFDKGNTIVGVVANRQGNLLTIIHKEISTGQKWSAIYRWKVSGWNLDGASHDTTISFASLQTAPANPVLSYKGTTIDAVISQLNAWFDGYYTQVKKRYFAYKYDESTVYVQIEPYENYYEYTYEMTGLTVDSETGRIVDSNSNTYAMNGVGSEYKGINWQRYYEVVSASTSSSFNPTEPISSLGTYPLSLKSYSSEIGKFARDIYGSGEEGYKKYLEDYMVRFPSLRGIFAEQFRSGKTNTEILGKAMYLSHDGKSYPNYPAANYCYEKGFDVEGLEKGNWFLPSMYDIMKIWSKLTYGHSGVSRSTADPINRSLYAIGANAISTASLAWSSCRNNGNGAWFFSGYGCSRYDYFYYSFLAVPFLLLPIRACES